MTDTEWQVLDVERTTRREQADHAPVPGVPVKPYRSDTLVARVLSLSEGIERPDLEAAVRELCAYHLALRNQALRMEDAIHHQAKRCPCSTQR